MDFNSLLLTIQPNLLSYAYFLTRDTDLAKDLLQETNLKALANQTKFTEDTNISAWTFIIMRNNFINIYRKNKKFKIIHGTVEDLTFLIPSHTPTPESEYHTKEILKHISHIDPVQRQPFEMHLEGFKYEEIATILNIPMGTLKSRIFFTRKKLMKTIENH